MSDDRRVLTFTDVEAEELADWRPLFARLHARFETGSFVTGMGLVQSIGEAAEAADHHPDVVLTYPWVEVRLSSHDVGGITARDVRLAREISELAAAAGVTPAPARPQVLELALDTPDHRAIAPFWAALLGYDLDGGRDDELVDPDGLGPTIWFQASEPAGDDAADVPDQRWHLDVRVAPELAQPRLDAAVAAGGTLVDDRGAPAFWVLADAQGNRACVTTGQGREG